MKGRNPYDVFASVYDQPEHVLVAQAFHGRLRRILSRLPTGATILDLGCGSGGLTKLLLRDGFKVVGVDRSRRMLERAHRRCRSFGRRASFHLSEFDDLPRCNAALAVACGDVVNHVSSKLALARLFRSVRRSLSGTGVLAFDALRSWCFESYWDRRTYMLECRAGELIMQCTWSRKKKQGRARMVSFARTSGGLRRKRETVLREYLYEESVIRKSLVSAGFVDIESEQWSPWPDQHLESEMDRTFWEVS